MKKKQKKRKSLIDNSHHAFAEKTHYSITPSYFSHNGKHSAIVQMYVRFGSNRELSYSDVLDFIPSSTLQGVEIYLLNDDLIIKGDEKKRLITKNAPAHKNVIENDDKDSKTPKQKSHSSQQDDISRSQEYGDFDIYQGLINTSEPIVVYRLRLIVVAETKELVDEQIEQINTYLSKASHDGALWDSLPGEQLKNFTALFDPLNKDRFGMTTYGSNYAGLNFTVDSGLSDINGIPIGKDVMSLSQCTAFFDFERSTSSQAMIAIPRNSKIPYYEIENASNQISSSSIMAQAAANHFVMRGHRAHHIVLNDFDYFADGIFYRPHETKEIFKQYDVSKTTVNVLQGFGELKDVVNIKSRLDQKIVNIFDLLLDLKLSKDEKAVILRAVENFYLAQGYWIADADIYPARTQIVNLTQPETYRTLGDLVNSFSSLAKKALAEHKEILSVTTETLETTLKQALNTYRSALGRTTTIKPTDALQVYYSFQNVDDTKLRQIQFVNLVEYVISSASKDDVIVIHGFDTLYKQTASFAIESIKAAQKKGIRFIFAFDTLTSMTSSSQIEMNSIFNMQQRFYVDLDTDVDWSMIGRCTPDEVEAVTKALNTHLSDQVIDQMQAKVDNQCLIHRRLGDINNFVQLNPII